MALGFDTAASTVNYAARLAEKGYTFAARYLGAQGDWRRLTQPEVATLNANGIAIVSISESGAGNQFSAERGAIQAEQAMVYAHYVGQPEGSAIYYAIDTDRAKAADVLAHFDAIANVIAKAGTPYDIGAYGPGALLAALLDAGLVKYTWLANARSWPGYAAFKDRADILQGLPMNPFPGDGFAIDPDTSAGDEIGAW